MGFPIRNGLSNVLGGFNEIFLISRSAGRFFAGTIQEGYISGDDRTLGVIPGVTLGVFGALRWGVATVGKPPRDLPIRRRHSPDNCKVAPISHTDLITTPYSRPLRYGSVFLLVIAEVVADDGLAYCARCDI